MYEVMCGFIQKVLICIVVEGLLGKYYFFIIFDMVYFDVELVDWLFDCYLNDMMIVLEYWFENLIVIDEGFLVILNFGDNFELLYVFYDVICMFVDFFVEFGLCFEIYDEEIEEYDEEDDDEEVLMEEMVEVEDKFC